MECATAVVHCRRWLCVVHQSSQIVRRTGGSRRGVAGARERSSQRAQRVQVCRQDACRDWTRHRRWMAARSSVSICACRTCCTRRSRNRRSWAAPSRASTPTRPRRCRGCERCYKHRRAWPSSPTRGGRRNRRAMRWISSGMPGATAKISNASIYAGLKTASSGKGLEVRKDGRCRRGLESQPAARRGNV